ncbi:Glutamyl endopeptidase [Echria macrotheca]|uniref:Glutamyl endopeptidase n=1 Tax=Echria macrotheca TaxID=438768 RepID=A0AAJ0F5S5_9PEZI|nr:Glutamyl endopeptidase [Echria macrotheca]
MSTSPRRTRRQRKALMTETQPTPPDALPNNPSATSSQSALNNLPIQQITPLPARLTAKQTALSRSDHALLLRKQSLLRTGSLSTESSLPSSVAATLVFAQHEAGTAVCIRPSGILLTCAHCVAESPSELDLSATHWLIFASGTVVGARCVAWDPKLDLALLRVVASQQDTTSLLPLTTKDLGAQQMFPAVDVAEETPPVGTKLVCVGHPGSEDLEAPEPGRKTGYDVLHASFGRFRGCAMGQDPLDNEEIGALMHDCWTYWGHSGAPLLDKATGKLVGLHSSWDDTTGMRRGVPLDAVRAFLAKSNTILATPDL